MNRSWSMPLAFCLSGLLLIVVWTGTQADNVASKTAVLDNSAAESQPTDTCFWNILPFGVDDWITSAPTNTILATFTYETQTYPALVATQYGGGKAVYAPGSLFSEIDNLASPHNVRHEIFLNSVKWVTNDQVPTSTTVLVAYGHRELVTYDGWEHGCCSSNVISALEEAGYTVAVTSDIPLTLTSYSAVIMPGVGWFGTPQYPDPLYWSGNTGHAPTPAEVATLLGFVQNGGGLVASVEYDQGADWMNPIGMPMSVTFGTVSNLPGLQGNRVADHVILAKHCTYLHLPLVRR